MVNERAVFVGQRPLQPAASIMIAYNDVLDPKVIDRKLQGRKDVQIARMNDIGDVAMNEDFAGVEAKHVVGRHPAIRAADPQVARRLLLRHAAEEFGLAAVLASAHATFLSNR